MRCLLTFVCFLSWSLGACSTAHTSTGTETGNPPVINTHLVSLDMGASQVRLTGKAGAVTPGGATLEITNLTSGSVTKAKAAADGSFDVQVGGASTDAFSVRAVVGSQSSGTVYVLAGAAVLGDGKDGKLSCKQREQLAGDALARAVQDAAKSCKAEADCGSASTVSVCHDACSETVASKAGVATIEATVASIDYGLCAEFAQDGCKALALPCLPPPVGQVPRCVSGQCILAAPSSGSCDACSQASIQWRHDGGLVQFSEQSQLQDCTQYTHTRTATQPEQVAPSCASELTACTGTASRGALEAALANAEVQQALAGSTVLYGHDSRPVDGSVLEIKLGSKTFDVGDACNGQTGCIDIPKGLQALVDLLEAIDTDRISRPECGVFSGECGLSFDQGTGTSGSLVYWHDPVSLACLPRTYMGSAGNDNRFATQSACEQKCGTPSAMQCGSTRKLSSVCPQCGLAGGCLGTVSACAMPCTTNADCASDSIGMFCSGAHLCEVGGCL